LKRLLVLAAIVFATAPSAVARADRTVRIGAIVWYTDYDYALDLARQEHKPLWLHFGEDPG
jgi:hypothetical protein